MTQTEEVLIGKTGKRETSNGGNRYWIKEEGGERFWQTFDASTGQLFINQEGRRALLSWDDEHIERNGTRYHNRNLTEVEVLDRPAQTQMPTDSGSTSSSGYDSRQESIQRQTAAKCAAQILTGCQLPQAALGEVAMNLTEMFAHYFETGWWLIGDTLLKAKVDDSVVNPDPDDDIPY